MLRVLLILGIVALSPQTFLAQRGGGSAPAKNPFEGSQQAIQQGREIYSNSCTTCHGLEGAAGEMGPALGVPARRYSLSNTAAIFEAIKNGIPGTQMPAATGLSDEDVWKVATYIQALRGTAIDAPSPGDVTQGEQVFWTKGECGRCHMIRGKGGLIGPELSNVADIRKTSSILDALTKVKRRLYGEGGAIPRRLEPLNSYQVVRVTTVDNKTIRGVIKNEDSFSLQILGIDERLYLLDRSKVKDVQYESRSLMPRDYDKRLTEAELRNLVAFLTRQTTRNSSAGTNSGGKPVIDQ